VWLRGEQWKRRESPAQWGGAEKTCGEFVARLSHHRNDVASGWRWRRLMLEHRTTRDVIGVVGDVLAVGPLNLRNRCVVARGDDPDRHMAQERTNNA
jgi:hypothetical protein